MLIPCMVHAFSSLFLLGVQRKVQYKFRIGIIGFLGFENVKPGNFIDIVLIMFCVLFTINCLHSFWIVQVLFKYLSFWWARYLAPSPPKFGPQESCLPSLISLQGHWQCLGSSLLITSQGSPGISRCRAGTLLNISQCPGSPLVPLYTENNWLLM